MWALVGNFFHQAEFGKWRVALKWRTGKPPQPGVKGLHYQR